MAEEKLLVPLGKMQIINDRVDIAAGAEEDLTFPIPAGARAEWREATFHLDADSDKINVKAIELRRFNTSEKIQIIAQGDPNIKEMFGNGYLPRLMPVIETLEQNEDLIIKVKNNGAVSTNVSITLYVRMTDTPRDIAGQGV
jgi:hypothetical protein